VTTRTAARATAQRSWLFRVGGFSARHRATVIAAWVVLLIAMTAGHKITGGSYVDDFTLSNSPSQQAARLLGEHQPGAGAQASPVVFTVTSGSLTDDRAQIEAAIKRIDATPDVMSATDPFATGTVSRDGRTAYTSVAFEESPQKVGRQYVDVFDRAVAPLRASGVHVDYGGLLGQDARPKTKDAKSELIGIVVAVLVLLAGFGSVYAAGLPILSAVLGVGSGIGLLGMVASTTTFASVSPTLAVMMGLGVGIDYALFLTTRHRQLVMDGVEPAEAAARTVAGSGRAVLVAAVTVVIAMLGLYASGIDFIGKLGVAAAITVAVAALAALTLVPALLGLAGTAIDRRRVRTPVAEAAVDGSRDTFWHRYALRVGRHPWLHLAGGVVVLLGLAAPTLSMTLGHVDAGASPHSYTEKRAYDAMSAAFGPGSNAPLTVVVQPPAGASPATLRQLGDTVRTALLRTDDVASATAFAPTPDGALLHDTVLARSGPQDAATDRLLGTLRDTALPRALAGTGASGYVTGTAANQLDFRNQVAGRLPIIIGVVVAAAFVLLLLTFRSPVLALKAALLNLLSIGAAYSVLVAVFQWGWGVHALGVSEKVPVESYVPMMMFAIVFGLSMDYEVFLLSRIREAWLRTSDNARSVAAGLSATARVITCAALIMASVFLAFLLSTTVVIKMIALGLGVSVLIDATVIRLLVVPSTMFLLGRWNWWTPRWLDRWLPHLDPEGEA